MNPWNFLPGCRSWRAAGVGQDQDGWRGLRQTCFIQQIEVPSAKRPRRPGLLPDRPTTRGRASTTACTALPMSTSATAATG